MRRFMRVISDAVLPVSEGRVVIFVDEIDAVRSLPFSTDEFFAGIRECFNRRTSDPEIERLTFCLARGRYSFGFDSRYANHAVQHRTEN